MVNFSFLIFPIIQYEMTDDSIHVKKINWHRRWHNVEYMFFKDCMLVSLVISVIENSFSRFLCGIHRLSMTACVEKWKPGYEYAKNLKGSLEFYVSSQNLFISFLRVSIHSYFSKNTCVIRDVFINKEDKDRVKNLSKQISYANKPVNIKKESTIFQVNILFNFQNKIRYL